MNQQITKRMTVRFVMALAPLLSTSALANPAFSPSGEARASTGGFNEYSTFWTGFQNLPQRADAHGTPIRILGNTRDEYRVTEQDGKIRAVRTADLGADAHKFRSRQEEKCADRQAEEIKRISQNPKYRDLLKAGVFDSIDVEVQFSTYTSSRLGIPNDSARLLSLSEHVQSIWEAPFYEVHQNESAGRSGQSGRIVVRPFFSAFAQESLRGSSRPVLPVRKSTGDTEMYFACTVIPGSEILNLLDRVHDGAEEMRARGEKLPEPLKQVPTSAGTMQNNRSRPSFTVR
jgi:hypothetical protein